MINWKRPWNIPPIVESLREHEFIEEIIVWNNSPNPLPEIPGASIRGNGRNWGTYGRFLAASGASHDVIYTNDDDYLINNIPQIYSRHLLEPDAIAAALADTPQSRHYAFEANIAPWIQLGFGSFFNRKWIGLFDRWINHYGTDDLLLSKADRIFTVLHGNHAPLLADFTRLKDPDGGFSDSSRDSLWKQEGHRQLVREAVAKAQCLP